jgi:three-Cys-motif partner protein
MTNEYYFDREQSAVKHRILKRYLQAFAPIIGSAYKEIVYVDCLAGPWKNRDESLTDTSFHASLTVFQNCLQSGRCKKVRALLIENNPDSYAQLEAYGRSVTGVEVRTENWDFTEHISEIVEFCTESKNSFAFIFIDPTGWREICIDRIRPLLRIEPGEVLINFMLFWVKRFLGDKRKPFEDLLGEDIERLRTLEGEELEDELVNVYAALVRAAGRYEFTCAIPVMMPDRDAIHFHLVYGTRNYKGLEEFKKTEADAIVHMHQLRAEAQRRRDLERTGQAFLLGPEETYQERRFRHFHQRRIENAKTAVLEILGKEREVLYHELLLEAIQYSTVLEGDLREWLQQWVKDGLVQYINWEPRQKVPRAETLVRLIRKQE